MRSTKYPHNSKAAKGSTNPAMIPTRRNIAIRYAGPVSVGPAGIVDGTSRPPDTHRKMPPEIAPGKSSPLF
ncbi:hypothetical protein [Novosphingobium sp. LASN5T]|uniref:hypothetical protein n=1 Tax=Novosphingobium sp. LASN5T TaxID=2491021 RepID=UPI0016803D07|nr:hypothetical protein [Novosphingobium sp. LASN5T]